MAGAKEAARLDWSQQGAFFPERYTGKDLAEYEAAREEIERNWDNQQGRMS